MNPPRDYAAAAEWLGMSESWLRKQVAAGEVPHVKLGREVKFTEDHLETILRDRERLPKPRLTAAKVTSARAKASTSTRRAA